jgi:hypothetical protein
MEREPDVEIAASARADEVRFACKPEVRIGAHANVRARAEKASERENLPNEVEPGVTYKNVAVRWRLAARIIDEPE